MQLSRPASRVAELGSLGRYERLTATIQDNASAKALIRVSASAQRILSHCESLRRVDSCSGHRRYCCCHSSSTTKSKLGSGLAFSVWNSGTHHFRMRFGMARRYGSRRCWDRTCLVELAGHHSRAGCRDILVSEVLVRFLRQTTTMKTTRPNHALQRTRRERCGCNRCVPRAGSLSLGR